MDNYCCILIKPDAIRDCLDHQIIQDLHRKAKMKILWQKFWKLTESEVKLLYPLWVNESIFPYMVSNFLSGFSLVLLVSGNDTLHDEISTAKGKMNIGGGIRHKYRVKSIEEWYSIGLSKEQIEQKKAENRLHSTDTIEETALLLYLCTTKSEKEIIATIAPKVTDTMKKIRDNFMLMRVL